jgi:uncharacterized YigZ family protein
LAQYTITEVSTGEYKDKGSTFIAYLYPVQTVVEFEERLSELWKKYHDARHICYAYRIGKLTRENDDGEPNHSAGAPIMRALVSAELVNVGCMVIRYFGGIKLGVPGLIKAYGTAAKEAIRSATLVEYFDTSQVAITFTYDQTNMIKYLVQKHGLTVMESAFAEHCSYLLLIRTDQLAELEPIFQKCVSSWKIIA